MSKWADDTIDSLCNAIAQCRYGKDYEDLELAQQWPVLHEAEQAVIEAQQEAAERRVAMQRDQEADQVMRDHRYEHSH